MSGIGIGERAASMIENQKSWSNCGLQSGARKCQPANRRRDVLISMWIRGLALLAAACWSQVAVADGAESGTAQAGREVVIELRDYRFIPEEITVKVGTTVRWVNMERRQFHNIWFRGLDDDGREYFFPEESRTRTFEKPGTYPYICEPHDESHRMHGVVHVVE